MERFVEFKLITGEKLFIDLYTVYAVVENEEKPATDETPYIPAHLSLLTARGNFMVIAGYKLVTKYISKLSKENEQ